MKKIALLFVLLLAFLPAPAMAQGWTVINQALVFDRLMPAGTEVKVRVIQISDQFDARLDLLIYAESVFAAGTPGTAGRVGRAWRADQLRVGDVMSYTTPGPGFVGIFTGWDYRDLAVTRLERGYLLTMGYKANRWQVVVTFPDYE